VRKTYKVLQYILCFVHFYIIILQTYKYVIPLSTETGLFAFDHSRLLYSVEIYASTHKYYLDKLIKLNNKFLRIIQNKP